MITFLEQETNSQTTQWKRKHESTPIRPKVVASAGKRIATVQGRRKRPPTGGSPHNFTPTWKRVDKTKYACFPFLFHAILLHQLFPKGLEFSPGDWEIFSVNITLFGTGFHVFCKHS